MTTEEGQVECVKDKSTCNDKRLILKASGYKIPSSLGIVTRPSASGFYPDERVAYSLSMSAQTYGIYHRSIPWQNARKDAGRFGVLDKNIDPGISNGNEVDQKMCELMVSNSKKEGGAALDEIYEALCDWRMGTFPWGDIVADLNKKISTITCEFPSSIDFTDELIGPAHDVKYVCKHNWSPNLGLFVGIPVGVVCLLVLARVIKKKRGRNTNHANVGSSMGEIPIAKPVNANVRMGPMPLATSSDNPQYEL